MIFDVLHFSLHDGPGIRTTVFLKGCPLDCKWCHNPESKSFKKEIFYFNERCHGCAKCRKACGHDCHRFEGGMHIYERQNCTYCFKCSKTCPFSALKVVGNQICLQEVMEDIIKDKDYYKASSGGVTLSGGEPLTQPEISLKLLKWSKEEGIHTCVETSGYAPERVVLDIAQYTDLFLYDYKATGSELHMKLCGVDNKLILNNLEALCESQNDIILRCPVIPGLNDTKEHFREIVRISEQKKSIQGIELMFYHDMGLSKLQRMGIDNSKGFIGKSVTFDEKKSYISLVLQLGSRKLINYI